MFRSLRARALPVAALAAMAAVSPTLGQTLEVPAPSAKAKVEQRVGITDFSVDYSSPAVRGRKIFGGLVPYDKVWRTGANASTKLTASRDFTFGDTKVPKGTYAVLSIPGASSWTVVLSKNADAGADDYDTKDEAARVKVTPQAIGARERMTFIFSDTTESASRLDLEWDTVRVPVPIKVDTQAQVQAGIDTTLAEAWRPYYQAGRYLVESGGNVDTAIGYLDTSIGIKSTWWNNWWRAQALAKKGKTADAIVAGEKALEIGKGNETFEQFFKADVQKTVDGWKKGQILTQAGIFEAYAAGEAGAFFDAHFASKQDWERARRVARPLSSPLAAVLESQNAVYAASPARDANLRALRAGAPAVVTGQQTGLFLGPLYTVYKAASTIRLARWLTATWSTPVVPVFWLQTEDHDAAEIAVCHVSQGSGEPLTLQLPVSGDAVPVAHRVLPESITDLLAKLGEALSRLPHGDEHLHCLARHYRPGSRWGEAFAGVLATLFAPEGLVLIDPRDHALAPMAAPVHRRALIDSKPIAEALAARVRAIEASGWRAGVHVRDEAPLSFFHPDGSEGPRCRLAAAGGGFVEVGSRRTHTVDELLGLLDSHPAMFSTSALLRPILQDTWLETAAYVGGPAEVAYFAQMAPLYAAFDVPMPIIVPRVQLRLTDDTTRRALARHGLTPGQACHPLMDVLAMVAAEAPTGTGGDHVARRVTDGIDRVLADVTPLVRDAGEYALLALEKTRRSMARSAAKLGRNFERARLLRIRDVVDDVRRVQARLQPGGVPQERFFGFPSFAARHGQRAIVERVLAAAEPLRVGIADLDL